MAKRSVYRDFLCVLKEQWRTAIPTIRPLEGSFGRSLPRASTFYVGVAKPSGLHVFLNFQHSSYASQAGQFTLNVVLSREEAPPGVQGGPFPPDDGVSLGEGSYRVGRLLGGRKDKWWHLRDDRPPIVTEAWRPTSYAETDGVLREAVADVSRDVRAVLQKVGVAFTEVGSPAAY